MRVVSLLEQEINHQLISSPERLRVLLAQIHLHIKAVNNNPLTQPLLKLIGQHRRHYYVLKNKSMVGLGFQIWNSLTGAKGYSAFFFCLDDKLIYRLSDIRNQHLAIKWGATSAFRRALIDGKSLRALSQSNFILKKGWQTKERDLSSRQGVEITEELLMNDSPFELACTSFSTGALAIAHGLEESPYLIPNQYGVVGISQLEDLKHDVINQKWSAQALDNWGVRFLIILPDDLNIEAMVKGWRSVITEKGTPRQVFGQWRFASNDVNFEPITLNWTEDPYCVSEVE